MKRRKFVALASGVAAGTLAMQAQNATATEAAAARLDVSARMTVRPGKLEGFKRQAAECIRQTKQKDKGTLRYDWFLTDNEATVEIREAYVNSDALIEHRANIGAALDKLFDEFADNHAVHIYGEPSPKLRELANATMAGRIKWYTFLEGLETV